MVSVSGRDVLISFMKFDRSKPPAYAQSISVWPDGAVLLFPVPLLSSLFQYPWWSQPGRDSARGQGASVSSFS